MFVYGWVGGKETIWIFFLNLIFVTLCIWVWILLLLLKVWIFCYIHLIQWLYSHIPLASFRFSALFTTFISTLLFKVDISYNLERSSLKSSYFRSKIILITLGGKRLFLLSLGYDGRGKGHSVMIMLQNKSTISFNIKKFDYSLQI